MIAAHAVAEAVFWASILMLGYTYFGYPALLRIWTAVRRRDPCTASFEPNVSVLVAAHNEAAHIERRLANLLELDYPRNRVEILVGSDGSTDATVSRARKYGRRGVTVVAFEARRGKSSVLNDLVRQARGDIVVFADARQRFDAGALRALAAHFADPEVGAVSGELVLMREADDAAAGEGVGFYWKYEKFIRRNEARVDSAIGATGAIYAIRRRLYEPIAPDTLLDDVVIPMRIARQGYRVTFEPAALAYDRTVTAKAELARKVRTLAGNFQLFARERWLLDPRSNRLWLQTVSHKACRLLGPLFLLTALASNAFLLDQAFYRLTLAGQIALYAAAFVGHLIRDAARSAPIFSVPYAFCLLNWAVVAGFVRFINGRQSITWDTAAEREPSRRTGRVARRPLVQRGPDRRAVQRGPDRRVRQA